MPQYRCTAHALKRLRERCPDWAACIPDHINADSAEWPALRQVAIWAWRARPYGDQLGCDLLLRLEQPGLQPLLLAVSPCFERDRWVIKTVLTEPMAEWSVAQARSRRQDLGRQRRRGSGRRQRQRGSRRTGRCSVPSGDLIVASVAA